MKFSVSTAFGLYSLLSGLSTVHAQSTTTAIVPGPSGEPRYRWLRADGDKSDTPPWGGRTAYSDPEDSPDTGVVRKYDWTVARKMAAPDGFEQEYLLVNGEFPGPKIEANWGDIIEVTVRNNITGPEEGTAIHWHGIHQVGTPWMDGVSGITQCPITPGGSFTYRFKASTYGTTWWHGHHAIQYAGGLWGPIVIHGPDQAEYDIDVGPIMLSDLYHWGYEDVAHGAISTSNNTNITVPNTANQLVNGLNPYNCSKVLIDFPYLNNKCTQTNETAKFYFQSGKTHRLRLINTGAQALQIISIDNHMLTVVQKDFVPVEPYDVEYVAVNVGERYEVLVKGTGNPEAMYNMRMRSRCLTSFVTDITVPIYYEKATPTRPAFPFPQPTTQYVPPDIPFPTGSTVICGDYDNDKKIPLYQKRLEEPDVSYFLNITYGANYTNGNHLWYMNNVSFQADWSRPLLLEAQAGNTSYLAEKQHILSTVPEKARTVRIYTRNNFSIHPMHLHGGTFQVISEGPGDWDGTVRPRTRRNPPRMDTQSLRRFGHLVVQFETHNPGVWSFHCHVAWHASPGFVANYLVGPDRVKEMNIPQEIRDQCATWGNYKNGLGENALPFDSGLRIRQD